MFKVVYFKKFKGLVEVIHKFKQKSHTKTTRKKEEACKETIFSSIQICFSSA